MARLSFPLEGLPADHSNTASQVVIQLTLDRLANLLLLRSLSNVLALNLKKISSKRVGAGCTATPRCFEIRWKVLIPGFSMLEQDRVNGPFTWLTNFQVQKYWVWTSRRYRSQGKCKRRRIYDHILIIIPSVPPNNCQFVQDDFKIYTNLRHYGWSFNLVHLRAWECNVRNWDDLLDDIHGVLRPGGVLLIIEANSQIVGRDGRPIQAVDEEKPVSWTTQPHYRRNILSRMTGVFLGGRIYAHCRVCEHRGSSTPLPASRLRLT